MPIYRSLGTLADVLGGISWPVDFFSPEDLPTFLRKVYVLDYKTDYTARGFSSALSLAFEGELSIELPGLDGVKLVAGGNAAGYTFLKASLEIGEDSSLTLHHIQFALRFDKEVLKPATLDGSAPTDEFVEIRVEGNVIVDSSFNIRIEGFDAFTLTPCMIGNSGIVITADDVKLDFSRSSALPEVIAAGFDENFLGVFIGEGRARIPREFSTFLPQDIIIRNCAIGTGGFTGVITGSWNPALKEDKSGFEGSGAGTLFGIPFALKQVEIEFRQNSLVRGQAKGIIIFPFFDQPALVDINLATDGGFTIALSADQCALPLPANELPERNLQGLFVFTKEDLLKLTIKGLAFEHSNGNLLINIGGSIKPLLRGLDWPEFDVRSLSIDSHGRMKIGGGWLDLPTQKSFDLYGFSVNITKIGFGNEEDGTKWIGLSGGIKLVDGLPLEGSVEGLRIKWKPPTDIEMEIGGIRVAFEIKDVLKFNGSVAFIDEPTKKGFKGGVKMVLYPLDGCSLDAQLMVGKNNSTPAYTFFYTYIGAELPVGVPLFSTGLALYGMAGLFGCNIEPSKGKAGNPNETWYENPDGSPGWYLRNVPGITDASTKWLDKFESMAFGAGITLGTLPDNGFNFSAKTLIVLLIPGPVMIVEGKANFLKERKKLDENPLFRVLAVYDNRAGTFLMNIEANYALPEDTGKVIKIRALAEAFFDFNNPQNWHLYIGQDQPEAKRIRAEILKLFEANTYFMLTNNDLAMGAWVGYDNSWKFGPLRVELSAWMEGRARITFKPAQAEGELTLQGDVQLRAFGVSVGLNVAAGVQVQTPNPFLVHAELRVKLNLPWPLPDPKAHVVLEWKEEREPPIPVPLAKFGMEHLKVTEKWTLDRYPEYDGNADGFSDGNQIPEQSDALQTSPVIPLDSRPVIVFAKPMEDAAKIGDNPMPPLPPESVGEGYQYRYRLVKVILEKRLRNQNSGAWTVVGIKSNNSGEDVGELYGKWQIAPENGQQTNTKLMLWTNTSFEISRELSNSEIFSDPVIGFYNPCSLDTRPREVCIDFEGQKPGTMLPTVSLHDDVIMYSQSPIPVVKYDAPWCETTNALVLGGGQSPLVATHVPAFTGSRMIFIVFSEPVARVELCLGKGTSIRVGLFDEKGGLQPDKSALVKTIDIPADASDQDMKPVSIEGEDIMALQITGNGLLAKVCYITAEEMSRVKGNEALQTHIIESTELHWDQHKNVIFEPNMYYKLTAVSEVVRNDSETFQFVQHSYFQTEGAPGVHSQAISRAGVSLAASSDDHFPVGGPLKDLAVYVKDTIPKVGQKPVYRAYDIGIIFNEPHVDQMYLMSGMTLAAELFDNNDQTVLDVDGTPISLQNQWGDNPQVFLTREEEQWIRMLDDKGCISLDYQHKPRNRNLYSGHKRMGLKPETLYKAKLTAISNTDGKKYVVHQFSFITSKYASFIHQIQSFQDVVWSHGRLLGSASPLLAPANKTILEDILSSINPGNSYQADVENKKFQQISELFGLGIRQLPISLEILALDDDPTLVGANSRSYGFLIESPEPIDWNRVSLTASLKAAGAGTELMQEALEKVKILGAGISSSGGADSEYNNEWVDILLREDFDIRGLSIEHKSAGSGDFQEYFTFGNDNLHLPAGTIVRVHSGRKQDDTNPSPDLEHQYAESSGWHFSSAGETIRIIDKEGNILHSRYVTPYASYFKKNTILIRNADNTRAFLFFPGAGEKAGRIDNGSYAFSFRYKLNIGDNKPVLKRMGGVEVDEETRIEFSYPAILPQ